MGTRAVTHLDLRPFGYGKDIWIATHWDGYESQLGKDLKEAVKKAFKEKDDIGGALQREIVKATAERHIDQMETNGLKEFNKRYGDWAEYLYEINPDGSISIMDVWKEAEKKGIKNISWTGRPAGKLKQFSPSIVKAKKKLERILGTTGVIREGGI